MLKIVLNSCKDGPERCVAYPRVDRGPSCRPSIKQAAAAERLLASADFTDAPEDDWVVSKAAMEQELTGKLP